MQPHSFCRPTGLRLEGNRAWLINKFAAVMNNYINKTIVDALAIKTRHFAHEKRLEAISTTARGHCY